jgi:hypothetical protein
MTATEYAIWSVCRALAAKNGVVYFSGPKVAGKFRSMGRNTPYTTVKSLIEMGWFKKIKESHRRADNTFTPTHYRVLTHEEWALEHSGCCVDPSQHEGTPSQPEGTDRQTSDNSPSQLKGTPSQLKGSPSQLEGTNLYKQPIQETNADSPSSLSPSQLEGMDFIDKFKRKPRQRGNATAQVLSAQPSPLVGTGATVTADAKKEAENSIHLQRMQRRAEFEKRVEELQKGMTN